jgi:hypothetical protein
MSEQSLASALAPLLELGLSQTGSAGAGVYRLGESGAPPQPLA